MLLPGTPSDEVDEVLATGRGEITTLFVSMARRHPEGTDAEYLRWHTLDHRPEQHRLAAVRASLRLVSTPACRAARASSDERFDAIDHVMTYFFTDQGGLTASMNSPRRWAARTGSCLCCPRYSVVSMRCRARLRRRGSKSAPTCCPGGRPWAYTYCWSRARHAPADLADVDGVAGVWSVASQPVDASLASAPAGQSHHVLLPRRRPGWYGGAVTACAGDSMGARRRRTAARRALPPRCTA